MDTSHIPKTFWHSLSFCMVVGTLGLLIIAYKASSVSFEIANAKIVLSSTISQAKEIKSELDAENKRLLALNQRLEEQISVLEKSGKIPKESRSLGELMRDITSPYAVHNLKSLESKIDKFETNIKSAQEAIQK